jgi:hypothetical protein
MFVVSAAHEPKMVVTPKFVRTAQFTTPPNSGHSTSMGEGVTEGGGGGWSCVQEKSMCSGGHAESDNVEECEEVCRTVQR